MKNLLIALNVLLLCAIAGVAFFWHPQPAEQPLPGTYAAKLGQAVPEAVPVNVGSPTAGIEVVDPHVKLMPPGVRTTAAYMTLRNGGEQDARLVAASCSMAGVSELHTHIDDKGVMRMRQVKEIVVPARGETALRPGGNHLMLIDLKAPLVAGDKLALTLAFADGSTRTVEAIVR